VTRPALEVPRTHEVRVRLSDAGHARLRDLAARAGGAAPALELLLADAVVPVWPADVLAAVERCDRLAASVTACASIVDVVWLDREHADACRDLARLMAGGGR
jgi:4'-phosphopantetheinyl transferase EntD